MQKALTIFSPYREGKVIPLPLFNFIRASEPSSEDVITLEGYPDINYLLLDYARNPLIAHVGSSNNRALNIHFNDLIVMHDCANIIHQKDIIVVKQNDEEILKRFDKNLDDLDSILGTVTSIIKIKKNLFNFDITKFEELDLTRLIKHPEETMFIRVKGMSMIDAQILDSDLVVVDRAIQGDKNDIIAVKAKDGLTLKFWENKFDTFNLIPANKNFHKISVPYHEGVSFYGVTTAVIRILKQAAPKSLGG